MSCRLKAQVSDTGTSKTNGCRTDGALLLRERWLAEPGGRSLPKMQPLQISLNLLATTRLPLPPPVALGDGACSHRFSRIILCQQQACLNYATRWHV